MNLFKLALSIGIVALVVMFFNSLGEDKSKQGPDRTTSHERNYDRDYDRSDSYRDRPDDSHDEGQYGADQAIRKDAINRRLRRY